MNEEASVRKALNGATLRRVLGHYPTGVCVITAIEPDKGPAAMIVGSFNSVSLDPPLVAFFPDRGSTSWPSIERAGKFCVNVLASHQRDLCRRFSTRDNNKFAGLAYRKTPLGSPVLDDVVAWIDCSLYATHEAGDHFIVLGQVHDLDVSRADKPLLFFRGNYGNFEPFS